MQQIWAPWRMTYIESEPRDGGCIFCDKIRELDARSALVLAQSEYSLVMLNKYPYSNGHLLVAPKRHEGRLEALPSDEYQDLSRALRAAVKIVLKALSPGGINVGMNLGRCAGAGIEDHLHWHIVPRWEGDTNFMPVVAETRVIPQHLLDSYDRFLPFFEDFLPGKDA